MLAKFPFGEATMGDVSANDGIAYFPIEINQIMDRSMEQA